MSPDELQSARAVAEGFEKAGFFLKAVAALKKIARADLPADDIHDTHLRLSRVYRAMGLEAEANRELLAVAAHWNDEGRAADARNLLAGCEALLPGGIAMLGALPADGEAGREALDALIRALGVAPKPRLVPPEDTPIDDLLPAPSLPSHPRSGPRVPQPQPALDRSANRSSSRIDEMIDRIGAQVEEDPTDITRRLKLAELLLKAGRLADGITHLVLAAKHHEKSGEPHKAIAVYKEVLKVAPERRELHNRLGDIFKHLGMTTEAESEYKKAEKP